MIIVIEINIKRFLKYKKEESTAKKQENNPPKNQISKERPLHSPKGNLRQKKNDSSKSFSFFAFKIAHYSQASQSTLPDKISRDAPYALNEIEMEHLEPYL